MRSGYLLLRRLLLAGDRNGLALACACVGVRALAANRKALAVAQAPIAAKVHQALDVGLNLAAQIAFDGVVTVDGLADLQHLRIRQLVHTALGRDVALRANLLREIGPDAVDIAQRDLDALARWNVDACD